jgi:hypothetical protein
MRETNQVKHFIEVTQTFRSGPETYLVRRDVDSC